MSFLIDPKTPFFLVLLKAPPARPAVSELLERLRAGRARGVTLLGPLDLLVNAGDSFLVLLLWLSREVIFRGRALGVTGALVPRRSGLVLFLFRRRGGSAGGAAFTAAAVVVSSSRLLLRRRVLASALASDEGLLALAAADASLLPLLVRDAVLNVRVDNCRLLLFVGGGGRGLVPRSRRVDGAVERVSAVEELVFFNDLTFSPSPGGPVVAERVLFTFLTFSPSLRVGEVGDNPSSDDGTAFLVFLFSLTAPDLEDTLDLTGFGDTVSSSLDMRGGGGGGTGTSPCCILNLCCFDGVCGEAGVVPSSRLTAGTL